MYNKPNVPIIYNINPDLLDNKLELAKLLGYNDISNLSICDIIKSKKSITANLNFVCTEPYNKLLEIPLIVLNNTFGLAKNSKYELIKYLIDNKINIPPELYSNVKTTGLDGISILDNINNKSVLAKLLGQPDNIDICTMLKNGKERMNTDGQYYSDKICAEYSWLLDIDDSTLITLLGNPKVKKKGILLKMVIDAGIQQVRYVNYNIIQELEPSITAITLAEYGESASNKELRYITTADFEELINEAGFINCYIQAIKEIYRNKLIFYRKREKELTSEYELMKRKVTELRKIDPVFRSEEAINPINIINEIITIKDIISEINNRLNNISAELIRHNLLDIINNQEYGIKLLVGRDDIKNIIVQLIFSSINNPTLFNNSYLNMAIYGKSGVGKSLLGKTIAYIMNKSMLLVRNTFLVKTRSDLVSQWIGGTAIKTKSTLLNCIEGILFIDEAYQLAGSNTDFGQESIAEILAFTDRYIGKCIIILAGYEDVMENKFMKINEGIIRRFPYIFRLKPYTPDDLSLILNKFLFNNGITLSDKLFTYLYRIIKYINDNDNASINKQAGDMQNLATILARHISSTKLDWDPTDENIFIPIVLDAVNEYLMLKKSVIRFSHKGKQ